MSNLLLIGVMPKKPKTHGELRQHCCAGCSAKSKNKVFTIIIPNWQIESVKAQVCNSCKMAVRENLLKIQLYMVISYGICDILLKIALVIIYMFITLYNVVLYRLNSDYCLNFQVNMDADEDSERDQPRAYQTAQQKKEQLNKNRSKKKEQLEKAAEEYLAGKFPKGVR